jgi:hypothetical protein
MTILDGASFWRNSLVPQLGNGQAAAKRIPFAFTSTLRLLRSGNLDVFDSSGARQKANTDQRRQLYEIEAAGRGPAMLNFFGISDIGTVIESVARSVIGHDMPVINMAVNPQSITWSQDKRIVKRDTMNGSTFFHFTDDASQNNDILKLSFSGKTGNINVNAASSIPNSLLTNQGGPLVRITTDKGGPLLVNSPTTGPEDLVGAIKAIAYDQINNMKSANGLKLRIWHELYNLSREAVILNPANTGIKTVPTGLKNEFFISYRTALFPTAIVFSGFFDKVLDFTESAQDPFNRDFGFSFTVTGASPSLDSIAEKISSTLALISPTAASK